MKILYGVSGEGFGHASHALVIADFLKKKKHKVIIVTYGQAYEILKNKFDVFPVEGIHLIYEEGNLNLKKSFFYNIKQRCEINRLYFYTKNYYFLKLNFKKIKLNFYFPFLPVSKN